MHESLLTKIRDYQPRAFRLGNGQLFCRLRQLPPELASEVLAYNERIHPRGAVPVVRSASPARSTAPPPKSPQQLALEALYQACFDRLREHGDRVTLATADRLSEQVGVAAATELIRKFGPGATMSGLALRHWARAAE